MSDITFNIKKDFGTIGDGKWMRHLTLTSWNNADAKYDLRPWNDDMTKCSKGITFTKDELYELRDLLDEILDSENEDDFEEPEE